MIHSLQVLYALVTNFGSMTVTAVGNTLITSLSDTFCDVLYSSIALVETKVMHLITTIDIIHLYLARIIHLLQA